MSWTPTAEQAANASTIVEVGRRLGASGREVMIALMTALQESGLRNLNHGDRDSLGLFQQRPSQGWGTRTQVTDPVYAATTFFQGKRATSGADPNPGLFDIKGRDKLTPTQAAQAVQRSGFPDAYAKWEDEATGLLTALSSPVPGAKVGTGYGVKGDLWKSGAHTGVDYPVPVGTPVRAVTAGTVIAEGNSGPDFGNWVKLKLANGYEAIFAHLSSDTVSKGDKVAAGQQIGFSGNTGNSTGPHLHYEIRKDGKAVNPTAALFLGAPGDDKQWWDPRDVPGLVDDKFDEIKGIPGDLASDAAGKVAEGLGAAAGKIGGAVGDAVVGAVTAPAVRDAGTRILAVLTGIGLVWVGVYRISAPARAKATSAAATGVQLAATKGAGAGAGAAAGAGAGKAAATKAPAKAAAPKPAPTPETPPF